MESQNVYLTKEGYQELEERLKYLKSEGRVNIAQKIENARSYGDITENSEYDAAREEEAKLQLEIMKLETTLRNAQIINKVKSEVVVVGSTVVVQDPDDDSEDTYTITGSFESDPLKGLISNESPIGKALLGAKQGELVSVHTANGSYELKIVSVK